MSDPRTAAMLEALKLLGIWPPSISIEGPGFFSPEAPRYDVSVVIDGFSMEAPLWVLQEHKDLPPFIAWELSDKWTLKADFNKWANHRSLEEERRDEAWALVKNALDSWVRDLGTA